MKKFSLPMQSLLGAIMLVAGFSANAQSSSGGISGVAKTGETIIVDSAESGFHRELAIKKDGKWTVSRVPTGVYVVTANDSAGNRIGPPQEVMVRLGATARVK